MPHTTLFELLTEIKSVLSGNFKDVRWIVAEVSEVKVNSKSGHCYIDLIDKRDGDIVAKIGTFIWSNAYTGIHRRFEDATGAKILPGMKLLIKVKVNFSETYGLKLVIHDVDPAYTIGEMEQQRQITLAALRKEGLIDRNKKLYLELPQSLAVISSKTAAGYDDFVSQLDSNIYGYRFRYDLYDAVMQGADAPSSIVSALRQIPLSNTHYDAVVIIRGGGSVADLNCFDNYDLARAVALTGIPVITGIGHEKDRSVVDEVAHTRLRTPTAVAEFLIDRFRAYEDKLLGAQRDIKTVTASVLKVQRDNIFEVAHNIAYKANQKLLLMHMNIAKMEEALKTKPGNTIDRIKAYLDSAEQKTILLDPVNVLKRGYSITYLQGKAVKDAANAGIGSIITTRLYNGTVTSVVTD